ncbi:hypothetical protein FKM82_028979 [Ascaphus truei]
MGDGVTALWMRYTFGTGVWERGHMGDGVTGVWEGTHGRWGYRCVGDDTRLGDEGDVCGRGNTWEGGSMYKYQTSAGHKPHTAGGAGAA